MPLITCRSEHRFRLCTGHGFVFCMFQCLNQALLLAQIIVIFGFPYTPDNIHKYGIVTFLFRCVAEQLFGAVVAWSRSWHTSWGHVIRCALWEYTPSQHRK